METPIKKPIAKQWLRVNRTLKGTEKYLHQEYEDGTRQRFSLNQNQYKHLSGISKFKGSMDFGNGETTEDFELPIIMDFSLMPANFHQ